MALRDHLRLKREDDPNDAAYFAMVTSSHPKASDVVRRARAAGLPWLNILRLFLEHGPKAIEKLKDILDALFPDEEPEASAAHAHAKHTPSASK